MMLLPLCIRITRLSTSGGTLCRHIAAHSHLHLDDTQSLANLLDGRLQHRIHVQCLAHASCDLSGQPFAGGAALGIVHHAAMAVAKLFAKENRNLITVGIGDSANDLLLLSVVYIPILVQRPGGACEKIHLNGVKKIEGVGPVGWTRAMEMLLSGTLS